VKAFFLLIALLNLQKKEKQGFDRYFFLYLLGIIIYRYQKLKENLFLKKGSFFFFLLMKVNGDAVCTTFFKSTSPFPTQQGQAFSIVKCMPSGQKSY